MNSGFMIEIDCDKCGQRHALRLDHSGCFIGPEPCDPTVTLKVVMDPQEWRDLVESEQAKEVQ